MTIFFVQFCVFLPPLLNIFCFCCCCCCCHFSRVRLFVTPWTAACQAPLSMGFSRQEYWSGVPLPSPSASVRSLPFLSFIEPIFAWNVPLVPLIILKRSLVFPILLFSSISLHWSLSNASLSLLAIFQNSAFKWTYLSFSPLLFASLLFTAICKGSSQSHFAFFHFFFLNNIFLSVFSWRVDFFLSQKFNLYSN